LREIADRRLLGVRLTASRDGGRGYGAHARAGGGVADGDVQSLTLLQRLSAEREVGGDVATNMEGVLAEVVGGPAVVEAIAEVALAEGDARGTILAGVREETRLLLVDVVETEGEAMRE